MISVHGGCAIAGISRVPDRPDAPLRITYITAPGEVGGLERVVCGAAMGLAQRGHDVHVIAVLNPEPEVAPFVEVLRGSPVQVHEVRLPAGVRHFLRERRLVRRQLAALKPDVVHTHGFRSDLLDGGVARSQGCPIVTTIHGESFMGGATAIYEWLQWHAYRRFDAVIAVSAPLHRSALRRGVPGPRLHLLRNALFVDTPPADRREARERLGIDEGERAIGWLGRMIPVKGADLFLRALTDALDDTTTAYLIGDGPERATLEGLTRALGLAERVRFLGSMPGAGRWLAAFDVFVLSSRSEGTPMVLLEAMLAGVPIVATEVGGVPDVVGNGAGEIVPAEDPAALASAIRHVLHDPAHASARSQAAQERLALEFAPERWLAEHERIYRSVRAH